MRKIFIGSLILASTAGLFACGSETKASDTQTAVTQIVTGNWEIVKRDSYVKFTATQQGNEFTGEFKDFTADINFDPDNIDAASVKAVIELGSVDAGDSERNDALPGKDWFYVKQYPTATFVSDDFRSIAEGEYEARGHLTIRDVTQPFTLPFTLSLSGDQAVMTGSVGLIRGNFGVGQGTWKTDEWVSLDVKVDLKVTATKR